MFRPEDIRARFQAEPFVPLRIVAREGLCYDIYRPGLVMVGIREILIGHDSPARPGVCNRITRLDLDRIVGIEEIPTQPTGPSGTAG